jgi:predicted 2-oxoglutarate/Fe(II)-dependent dioxygenase YbiX
MSASTKFPHDFVNGAPDAKVFAACDVLIGAAGRPGDPARAIPMLMAAMNAGSGAAAERLAVLAAIGVARPSDWVEAINLLVMAAERGHRPAQGQLAVLAGESLPGGSAGGPDLWKTLARRIDLKALFKAPELAPVREKPSIALVSSLATPAMCAWLMARGEGKVSRAKIGDYSTGEWVEDPVRTGEAAGFGLSDTDVILALTQKRLELASGLHVHQQEAPQILSYKPGQEYKAHYDFLVPETPNFKLILDTMGQRVATCLTWLNDDYEGGETAFLKIDWKHKGKAGDAMLFLNVRKMDRQPDGSTLHAGLPVTSGRKWLLSQWVRDRVQPIV